MPPPPTVTPVLVADLLAEGERMPLYVHVIDHPDARVLVDTGMTKLHPAVADLDPRLIPLSEQDFDLAGIDVVVNTHLHFDHCGGNHLFTGLFPYVAGTGTRLFDGVPESYRLDLVSSTASSSGIVELQYRRHRER